MSTASRSRCAPAGRLAFSLLAGLLLLAGPSHGQELCNSEAALLHRRVKPQSMAKWHGDRWVTQNPPERLVKVVHVWAIECQPCLAEFPKLIAIAQKYQKSDVDFWFVSESQDQRKWLEFIHQQHADDQPNLLHFKDNGALRAALQERRQPLTLLVDSNQVVRQAFVGALVHRRTELTDAIDRLLASQKDSHSERKQEYQAARHKQR